MDFNQIFLFELIFMRMMGFIMFSPIYARNTVPMLARTGFALVLSIFIYTSVGGAVPPQPTGLIDFSVIMLIELGIGFVIALIMRIFFSIANLSGEVIDMQMGLSMAEMYDAASQTNMSVTSSLFNIMLMLLFFVQNGHYTLMRILVSAEQVLPYGTASFGNDVAEHMSQIFFSSIILAAKLALPILAAQMLGVVGMGILMKAIPQINAFVINIELKVIMGLLMLYTFIVPISEFMLSVEMQMLKDVQAILQTIAQ